MDRELQLQVNGVIFKQTDIYSHIRFALENVKQISSTHNKLLLLGKHGKELNNSGSI